MKDVLKKLENFNKKTVKLVLALLMIFSVMLPGTAKEVKAEENTDANDTITISTSSVGGNTVLGDGLVRSRLEECPDAKKIIIEEGFTSIHVSAFKGFQGTTIIIPNTVNNISDHAFEGCVNLEVLTIPSSVKNIGENIFTGNEEYEDGFRNLCVVFEQRPKNTEGFIINENAFAGIGKNGSSYNPTLVFLDDGTYGSAYEDYQENFLFNGGYFNYCPFNYDDENDTLIFNYFGEKILGAAGDEYSDNIFDVVEDYYDLSFVKNIIVKPGFESIEINQYGAFSDFPNVERIELPNTITTIGDFSFSGCLNLKDITIPESVTTLGKAAFSYCGSLESITIPKGVKSLADEIFSYCYALKNFTIPNTITSIGAGSFSTCTSLESIIIPESVKSIGERAFEYCRGLTRVEFKANIGDGCNGLADNVFCGVGDDFATFPKLFLPDGWQNKMPIEDEIYDFHHFCEGYFDYEPPHTCGDYLLGGYIPQSYQDPTCTEDGHKDYYDCYACGKHFEDEECKKPILDLAAWLAPGGAGNVPKTGHSFTNFSSNGNQLFSFCWVCDTKVALDLTVSDVTYSGEAVTPIVGTEGQQTAWKSAFGEASIPVVNYVGRNGTVVSDATKAPINVGKYTASITKNGVSATCDFEISPKSITPTIEDITDLTYNGWAKEPTLTVKGDNKTLILNTDYTVEYKNNTNAGTAKATVYLKGNYSGTASKEFTINKADPVEGIHYTVPTGLKSSVGKTLADVNLSAGFSWVENANTSVGDEGEHTFHVKYTPTGTNADNYNEVNYIPVILSVVNKESQTLTFTNDTVTKTYGDQPFTNALSGANTTVTYSSSDETVATVNNNGQVTILKAGTVTITATAEEDETYAETSKSYTLTVDKREVEVEWSSTSFTYDGSIKNPTATIKNKVGQDNVTIVVTGGQTNVGTNITAIASELSGTAKDNYKLPGTLPTCTYSIGSKSLTNPTVILVRDSQTYTGSLITPVVTVKDGTTILKEGTDYELSGDTSATNVKADYKITVTFKGNYSGSAEKSWSITKANSSITPDPTAKTSLVYDGTDQALVNAGTATGGTLVYSTTQTGTYTESIPTGKNAGNYTVWYKVEGDSNHSDTAPSKVDVTIAKKSVKVSGISATAKDYDGTTNVTLNYAHVSFTGKLSSDELEVTAKSSITDANAGEKEVTLSDLTLGGKSKDNYVISNDRQSTTTLTINPKDINVTITPNGGTYDSTINPATVNVTGYVGSTAPDITLTYYTDENCTNKTTTDNGATTSGGKPTNAGDYYVKATITSDTNYRISSSSTAKVPYPVNKADASNAKVAIENTKFEGNGQTPITVTVNNVTLGNKNLSSVTDYDIAGYEASSLGKHKLTITFKGNYSGTIEKEWIISEKVEQPTYVKLPDDYIGKLTVTVTKEDSAPAISANIPTSLLSPSELNALKNGSKDIDYILTLKNKAVDESTTDSSIVAIKEYAKDKGYVKDSSNLVYLDITLDKITKTKENNVVVDTKTEALTSIGDEKIEITVDISFIDPVKSGYKRSYNIIRSHKNADNTYIVDKLDASYSDDKLTFKTNMFSDYAISYVDTLIPTPTQDPTTPDSTPDYSYIAPNTGVTTTISNNGFVELGAMAIGTFIALISNKKKDEK